MTALLLALIVFATTYAPDAQVRVTRADTLTWTRPADGEQFDSYGLTSCTDGQPSIQLRTDATVHQQEHEWAHAAACVADGQFLKDRPSSLDGSMGSTSPTDLTHSFVFWCQRQPVTCIQTLEAARP